MERRHFLLAAGAVAGGGVLATAETGTVSAASSGYGAGGYGAGGYGVSSTDTAPSVQTGSANDVSDTTATLKGDLTDKGGADSVTCYFQWRTAGASSWNETVSTSLSSTGSFSASLSGLSSATDYEFRAVVDASDGDSATGSTIPFTTVGSTPVVGLFSAQESGSPNPHAEIDVDWAVSDAGEDLATVVLKAWEVDNDGSTVIDSVSHAVSGGTASGSESFRIKHVGSQEFTVDITVTDAAGNTMSETQSVTS